MHKPQIVALNKTDITSARENIIKFKKSLPRLKVFPISSVTGEGVKELLKFVHKKVKGKRPDAKT